MNHKYAVIYETTKTGYSVYAPDLPGCIATGQRLEQTGTECAKRRIFTRRHGGGRGLYYGTFHRGRHAGSLRER